ncbi:MAG: DUF3592 domain-containing protein [Planctomycetota bacterium]
MENVLILLPVLAILIGAASIYYARQNQLKRRAAQAWPTAPGQILTCRVYEEKNRDKDGSTSTQYRRSIEYEYAVGEKTYRSKRIDFGNESIYHLKGSCERALQPYRAGATVPVYYNPDNAEDAVLDVKKGSALTLYCVGVLFLGVGLLFLYFTLIGGFRSGDLSHVLKDVQ